MSESTNDRLITELQTEIRDLYADREQLYHQIDDLRQENGDLKRTVERQGIIANAVANGAAQSINKAIEHLQVERDEALKKVEEYADLVSRTLGVARHIAQESRTRASDRAEELNHVFANYGVPQMTQMLHLATSHVEDYAIRQYQTTQTLMKQAGVACDPYVQPGACLVEAMHLRQLAAIRDVMFSVLTYAYGFSDDPRILADEILRECRLYGEPNMKTLEKLPMEWLQANLPDPPNKYVTLHEALQWLQIEAMSGLNREAFIRHWDLERREKYIAPRTLRKYQGWRDKLEEIARTRPTMMLTKLERQENRTENEKD